MTRRRPTELPPTRPGTLSARTLRGVVLLLAQNAGSRVVTFGSQLMLAWFLMPADFGLVGLAGVVTNFVSALQYFGVEDVLLQRKGALRFWVDPAFRLSLTLGLLSGVLVLISAPVAAFAFDSKRLIGMLSILALSMPLNALSTVPSTLLRAEMRFGVLAAYSALENLGLSVATVILAWRGYGPYSFALPVPVFSAAKAVSLWLLAPLPKNRLRRKQGWKHLFNNSFALFLARVINGGIGQGDYFALGIFCSHAVVGMYYFAFRLASQPIMMLAANLNAVVYPALLQLHDAKEQQCEAALKAASLLNHCIMFMAFLQAALARPVLQTLFGSKWLDAIPLIQLLSIGLAFDGASWIAGSLLGARGQFVKSLRYISILGSFFFLFVGLGAYWGAAFGTALGVCAYYMITQPIYAYFVFHSKQVPLARVAAIYVKPTAMSAAAVGFGAALARLPLFDDGGMLQAVITGSASLLAYVGVMRYASPDTFHEIVRRVAGAMRRAQTAHP